MHLHPAHAMRLNSVLTSVRSVQGDPGIFKEVACPITAVILGESSESSSHHAADAILRLGESAELRQIIARAWGDASLSGGMATVGNDTSICQCDAEELVMVTRADAIASTTNPPPFFKMARGYHEV